MVVAVGPWRDGGKLRRGIVARVLAIALCVTGNCSLPGFMKLNKIICTFFNMQYPDGDLTLL